MCEFGSLRRVTFLLFFFALVFGAVVGLAFRYWPFTSMLFGMMMFWGLFSRLTVNGTQAFDIGTEQFSGFLLGVVVGYWLEKLQDLSTIRWSSLSPSEFLSALLNTDAYATLRSKGPRRQKRAQNVEDAYTEAAARFGAMIADADDNATQAEFNTVCEAFDIPSTERTRVRKIFEDQIKNPRRLSSVLQTMRVIYPAAGGVMEMFILAASKVAHQDGYIHPRELNLIRLAAEYLGFSAHQRVLLLIRAGLIDPSEAEKSYFTGQDNAAGHSSLTERAVHLKTLGLKTNASAKDIRAAWRSLARKYHPDVLQSKGLSESEMKVAEAKMVEINAAYEALTV